MIPSLVDYLIMAVVILFSIAFLLSNRKVSNQPRAVARGFMLFSISLAFLSAAMAVEYVQAVFSVPGGVIEKVLAKVDSVFTAAYRIGFGAGFFSLIFDHMIFRFFSLKELAYNKPESEDSPFTPIVDPMIRASFIIGYWAAWITIVFIFGAMR